MSATAAAFRGRQRAEALMTSTCTVFTTGEPVTDPSSGEVTRAQTVQWAGKCYVHPVASGLTALAEAIGGTETFRYDYRVSIPFSVDSVFEGCRLTVTDSPDPALVGLTLEIQRVARGDNVTARRLTCQRMA